MIAAEVYNNAPVSKRRKAKQPGDYFGKPKRKLATAQQTMADFYHLIAVKGGQIRTKG